MEPSTQKHTIQSARKKFLELSLKSTRKSYYPQLKKQLEHAQKNEQRLQLLIDSMPAQIFYIDSDERCVFVNRKFEADFGLKKDRIIGRPIKGIVGKKTYNRVKTHIKDALSGNSGRFEFSFATKKAPLKWYEINYVPETGPNGKTNGFYVLTIDLTDKKEAEEEQVRLKDQLRQAQKMEAIGTLSGGITHDFNNILSGIFGYSQLADIHLHEPEKAKEYINKIFKAAKRASSLIQQILTFSRQTEYSKQPISFFTILTEALQLIRSTIPSSIEIQPFLNSKAMVMADSTQLHQVIMNLCTNASHAIGANGGILTIRLDEVNLSQQRLPEDADFRPGRYLRLEVCDTGPGIPNDIKERVFDPYFTTKKMGKGTGLGLAVVDGIVKKHRGFIELDTRVGVGSTFQVYLPVIQVDQIRKQANQENDKDLSRASGRLMLVDDETAILETYGNILSDMGFNVTSFDNGRSALTAFNKNPDHYDIIVTDMTMPKMTGDKLSMEALKIRPDIPIVICTGYHENFTKEDALQAGIKKYVYKPVSGQDLAKILKNLLPNQ